MIRNQNIWLCTVLFPCPPLSSMASTQPTPQPPNPTTDSEETPPTTNQQTVDPLTTSDRPAATDSGDTVTAPTTSEIATDLPIQRPSEPNDIGLIIGIVVIVIVVIVSVVTVLVIIAVLFKRHGNMMLNKKQALSNPTYSIKGQCITIQYYHYMFNSMFIIY